MISPLLYTAGYRKQDLDLDEYMLDLFVWWYSTDWFPTYCWMYTISLKANNSLFSIYSDLYLIMYTKYNDGAKIT